MYSYLRRLGYVVTRTKPPTDSYPQAAPFIMKLHPSSLFSSFKGWMSRVYNAFTNLGFNWWRPLQLSRWLRSHKLYSVCFRLTSLIRRSFRMQNPYSPNCALSLLDTSFPSTKPQESPQNRRPTLSSTMYTSPTHPSNGHLLRHQTTRWSSSSKCNVEAPLLRR